MADDTGAPETPAAPAIETPATPAAGTLLEAGALAATETPEATPEPEAPAEPPADDADAQNAKPVEYAEFTLPEGITLDTAAVEAFKPIAAELGLNQEQAQKLVNLRAEQVRQEAEAYAAQMTEWANTAKTDAELAGGQGFDANLASACATYAKVATPELRGLLDSTGYGNHPEVVRMFYRIGKQLGEDGRPPSGADPSRGQRSLEERLYGSSAT